MLPGEAQSRRVVPVVVAQATSLLGQVTCTSRRVLISASPVCMRRRSLKVRVLLTQRAVGAVVAEVTRARTGGIAVAGKALAHIGVQIG